MYDMRHLDLFSGIGGFSLAVDTVWHEEKNEHIFVEWDEFCTAVLKKHWPEAEFHKDIREFVEDTKRKRLLDREYEKQRSTRDKRQSGARNEERIHLLTGGFPCQPFSHAGRRKGTDDNRYLWPSMFDAITLFKPRWVIAENVAGLATWNDGLVLETVCADLESAGYEVQPFRIPAVAVGAPHRRDRVWIVGRRKDADDTEGGGRHIRIGKHKRATPQSFNASRNADKDASNNVENPICKRSGRGVEGGRQVLERESTETENARPSWKSNWIEVATRLCTVDDGLPNGLVRPDGSRDAKTPRPKGWRNAALKAAGNAIVPQVAAQIMKAIKGEHI